MLPRWHRPTFTAHHMQVVGLAAVAVGIGWIWLPGGIIVAGILLVVGTEVRDMKRGK